MSMMTDQTLSMINEALTKEEFDFQVEEMKDFMSLVLKIAFTQHLS